MLGTCGEGAEVVDGDGMETRGNGADPIASPNHVIVQ
jgi:hypothetical protein